eukprot:1140975-Pelagomonas_calceolata.AAC.4
MSESVAAMAELRPAGQKHSMAEPMATMAEFRPARQAQPRYQIPSFDLQGGAARTPCRSLKQKEQHPLEQEPCPPDAHDYQRYKVIGPKQTPLLVFCPLTLCLDQHNAVHDRSWACTQVVQ